MMHRTAALPDAAMALVFAAAALLDFVPPERVGPGIFQTRDELGFGLLVEGGFLMAQGTLVDIATRLRRRPPVWAVALILAGVVVLSGEAMDVLRFAWRRGALVFLPLLLSLAERAAVLWRMPDRPRIEKIAARALIGNRITTALVLFAVITAGMLLRVGGAWLPLGAGAVYFAVAACDQLRVRGSRFAERPTVLFRFDVLGVEYLEPV